MKTFVRLSILLLLLSTSGLCEPVAWVQKLYGEKNMVYRPDEKSGWLRAYIDQNARVGDFFKTDTKSTANLMFLLGGKAVLDKDTEIKIISERNVDIVSQGVELKKGNFWVKFEKPGHAPVRIKTAGGVMGIKGTELVVQVAEDGSTKLSLIEGSVEVADNSGKSFSAQPGNEVTFGPNEPMLSRLYEYEELQERLKADLGESYNSLRDSLNEFTNQWNKLKLPYRTAHLELTEKSLELREAELSGDLKKRRRLEKEYLAALRGKVIPGEGESTSAGSTGSARDQFETAKSTLDRINELLEGRDAQRDPENRSTPDPDERTAEIPESPTDSKNVPVMGSRPRFYWDWTEADNFAFLIMDPKDESLVHYAELTDRRQFTFPLDAKPLAVGQYRYRIIPVDVHGEPTGDPLEGRFQVQG